jgi:hypothetical protein
VKEWKHSKSSLTALKVFIFLQVLFSKPRVWRRIFSLLRAFHQRYRELDDALGLTSSVDSKLRDIRTGKNTQRGLTALLTGLSNTDIKLSSSEYCYWKSSPMKSSKSSTKIPVNKKIFFDASTSRGFSQCHLLI